MTSDCFSACIYVERKEMHLQFLFIFKIKHFHRMYFVPRIVVSAPHMSTYLILTPLTQWAMNYPCLSFIDGEVEIIDSLSTAAQGLIASQVWSLCLKASITSLVHGMLLLLLLSRFSCVRLCVTPETAAHQVPPSLGFSRQEHWSGLPFPSPMHESEKWKVKVKSLSRVQLLATPWTAAYQAPPSMGFSRQECWSGVPLPSPSPWNSLS